MAGTVCSLYTTVDPQKPWLGGCTLANWQHDWSIFWLALRQETNVLSVSGLQVTGRRKAYPPSPATNSGGQQGAIATVADLEAAGDGPLLRQLEQSGEDPDPADTGGKFTRAGRGLAKKPNIFGAQSSGSPAVLNVRAQGILEGIMRNPATRLQPITQGNFIGGSYFIAPDGLGAAFDASGTFQYFGNFPR